MIGTKGYSQSGHFQNILPRKSADTIITQSLELLWFKQFDTLAFCGLSGATLAPILAHLMQKELLMIRKNKGKDGSNSEQWVEGHIDANRVIVVDDLIFSGTTMKNIRDGIDHDRIRIPRAKVVGMLLHCNSRDGGPTFHEPGDKLFDRHFK